VKNLLNHFEKKRCFKSQFEAKSMAWLNVIISYVTVIDEEVEKISEIRLG
jgi:hypothetical protein